MLLDQVGFRFEVTSNFESGEKVAPVTIDVVMHQITNTFLNIVRFRCVRGNKRTFATFYKQAEKVFLHNYNDTNYDDIM
jgi:hypothetical protein